jgi:decaprenylphospho-beta-D-erythro-pentofuranosid-2-ulose 2-reductase
MSSDTSSPQHILVIGATSAIAERCARRWAADGAASIVLVARDAAKLQRVHDDLRARHPRLVLSVQRCADFVDPAAIEAQLDQAFAQQLPDMVLIAHGDLPDQAACQAELSKARQAIDVNGLSPVLWAEGAVRRLERAGRGTVAVIGSVAGDRGRQSNYVYGAAKGLVDRYVQGLQHRLADGAVRVCIVKPGPTATPMTAHLQAQGQKMASADDVAGHIVKGLRAGKPVIYTPPIWWVIMMVIKHLPRFVFHRMKI